MALWSFFNQILLKENMKGNKDYSKTSFFKVFKVNAYHITTLKLNVHIIIFPSQQSLT